MVKQTTGTSPVRCAVRTHYYAVQTATSETVNPLAHFVGETEAPKHAIFVEGRLHSVQVGWSKEQADKLFFDYIEEIMSEPERVIAPVMSLREIAEINRAVEQAEQNLEDHVEALRYLAPTLAKEVRRLAGNCAWKDWASDYVQTEMRSALEASLAAVDVDTPPMTENEVADAIFEIRSVRVTF